MALSRTCWLLLSTIFFFVEPGAAMDISSRIERVVRFIKVFNTK
jgi:hypothetical protein